MEAKLHTPQVPPGDETQFMHAAFTSDKEMLDFYLIFNRFVNPVTYFMQRTDKRRLEDLLFILGKQAHFLFMLETNHFLGINPLVQGFGLFMLKDNLSKQKRIAKSEEVASQLQFLTGIASGMDTIKQMNKSIHSHIQNVMYLIDKMKEKEQADSPTESNEP
ncbi:MAG: hypothetical protein LUI85_13230 [Bacteroides sp.]|nr:hypothetical protein [Bacteroides sp.]